MPAADGDVRVFLLDAGDLDAMRAAADAAASDVGATVASAPYPRIAKLRDRLNAPGAGRLAIVVDDPELRRTREFASLPRTLSAALGIEAPVADACIVALGDALADGTDVIDDTGTLSSLDALTDAIAETVFEVRRRSDSYFQQEPLALPAREAGSARLLTAGAVLAWLSTEAPAGLHVVYGDRRITWLELADSIARLVQVPTRVGTARDGSDAVLDLLETNLRHAEHVLGYADDTDPLPTDVRSRRLRCDDFDWHARIAARVAAHAAAHERRIAPRFVDLPSARRITTGSGHVYLNSGRGSRAMLLINAFGIPHDVWHDFAVGLAPDFSTYLVDDADAAPADAGLTCAYYSDPDAPGRYARSVAELLDVERIDAIHVASWCGGARYAFALARALPGRIASMSLIAPSFAGAHDYDGADSAYENNLNTMCSLVARMPKAADSMAKSMTALLEKRERSDAREGGHASMFALADSATRHWLHAPFVSATNMIEYSRQLLNFRAHRVEAERDRSIAGIPAMLVTGEYDEMTCAIRARAIASAQLRPVQIELRGGSHHMVHQNAALLARLVRGFVDNPALSPHSLPHPRLRIHATADHGEMESGEL
ncbi:alpha/beta hydrolase [Burkholderia lata]|uniref:alpha/beta hydrolase n=1 Tax=Burkholderia lata (strain ATCC 17760 / DSM 23089 / LMG 22485 / NCIMB 9086 / R18194 / 383) TaxID=482957 RepID=UPI0015840E6C|nr:alpha/beta hydrolase [Burkholderia lata]